MKELKYNKNIAFRCVPLPIGYQYTACPKCRSLNLTGALLTKDADELDPNVLCKNCGYCLDEGVVY